MESKAIAIVEHPENQFDSIVEVETIVDCALEESTD